MQRFYTVRPGETLYLIAKRWELPVESLIAANNINPPYIIYPGQQLSVPPGVDIIRVMPGDSVYKIAQVYGVPQEVIIEANNLQFPYIIQVGQLLKVPPGRSYYIVQHGDTLFTIANKYNVMTGGVSNYELIRRVNQLPSNEIFLGMRLLIPYAPTGDRGFIAYTSNRTGTYDIWLYNLTNGTNQQLTFGLGESFSIPFWSPDAKKISFVGKNNILYIVQIGNGAISRIDQFEEGTGVYLDWSPNSQNLAYTKGNYIVLYNMTLHQAIRLNQSEPTDVQWFPSGVELLYQAPDLEGISQLFRIRIDGTGKRQITQNTGGRLNTVRLSPDGLFALYTTPGVSISIIFTVEVSTGRVFEISGGPLAKNYHPVWSLNSMTIAYSATAFENRGYFSLIRTVGRRGENDQTKAISNCFATPVTWSPTGRKIAYLSGCNNQGIANEMWVLDVNHPVPIRLISGSFITSLQWSPQPISPLKNTYTNSVYKVQFQYPAHWQRVNNERYEGSDGFFQISAVLSGDDIDSVCHNEAFHQLQPYGSEPRIIKTQMQNQEACFIYPSEDQPLEMKRQAALIVRYPTPVQIEGTSYNYFILWADEKHINDITTTLRFLE